MKTKKQIEITALVAGVLQPLFTLPQIIKIYSNQSAQDVSIVTWVGFLIFAIIFLVYGIAYKLRPIIVTQIIWVTMQTIMIFGILKYS